MTYSSVKRTKVLVVSQDMQAECIVAMVAMALISLIALFEFDVRLNDAASLSPAARLSGPEITETSRTESFNGVAPC